mmetsp:Transcript_1219/g.3726  ORF Transcript_1219/g.3726 Transcript_1219/m.3726 type:complete len:204 (-) Transcript_1219:64-675(-)
MRVSLCVSMWTPWWLPLLLHPHSTLQHCGLQQCVDVFPIWMRTPSTWKAWYLELAVRRWCLLLLLLLLLLLRVLSPQQAKETSLLPAQMERHHPLSCWVTPKSSPTRVPTRWTISVPCLNQSCSILREKKKEKEGRTHITQKKTKNTRKTKKTTKMKLTPWITMMRCTTAKDRRRGLTSRTRRYWPLRVLCSRTAMTYTSVRC